VPDTYAYTHDGQRHVPRHRRPDELPPISLDTDLSDGRQIW
jgi:hypothetical protein